MRILLITQYWAPENGVPQRRWSWLTQILEKAGHEVLVVAPPPHYLRKVGILEWFRQHGYRSYVENQTGVPERRILRTGYLPGGSSITQKAINQMAVAVGGILAILKPDGVVDRFRPNLVIGTVPALPTAFVAAVASNRFNIPYIIDLRDAWPELLTEAERWNLATGAPSFRQRLMMKGPLQLAVRITDVSLKRLLKGATAVISTSANLAKDLERNGHCPPRVWTIRNVFPMETPVLVRAIDREPSTSLNVLYAGTLGRAQNLANALKAAQIASKEGTTVRLRFVGAGAARDELMEVAEDLGVSATFERHRDASLLTQCYQWADTALVHLTDWSPLTSAVPSKTYELMNQGIHISGVVAGETAEIIENYGAGDVVPPEDPGALAKLWNGLAHNRARLDVGDEGARWVEEQRAAHAPNALLDCIQWVADNRNEN